MYNQMRSLDNGVQRIEEGKGANEPININVKQTPHAHLSHASHGHAQAARPRLTGDKMAEK